MLYLPPPEKSWRALRLLGVVAPNGPPKDWNQYEDLLATRLGRLLNDRPARDGLVNYLLNESLLEEDLENDALVEWLLNSDQYSNNRLVSLSLLWYNSRNAPKARQRLLKRVQKDPDYLKASAAQKLQELKSVTVWEWWESL